MQITPNWLAAPVLIPLVFAALGLAFQRWGLRKSAQTQRFLTGFAVFTNLLVAILILVATLSGHRIVLQVGDWQAPFGITLIADGLSGIMLTLTAILTTAIVPYTIGTIDQRERMNLYPIMLFLLMGVNGAFLAGDLFNLYVFFEVLLMASFVLLTLGGQPDQINGGIRYVVLNLLASMILLAAAGVAYGTLGTLNFAHLSARLQSAPQTVQLALAGLLLVAFASKAGLFPLFFWLPSSYHTPHPVVTALIGGLLTKVGIYSLFRVFPLLFPELLVTWQPLILTIAGLTMLVGVFGAMAVDTVRRVLSFHIISQVGYMVMGLGLAMTQSQLVFGFGMAAGILYLVHHMIVKTALLMAGGAAEMELATGSLMPNRLGDLVGRRSLLAAIFFLAAFSLAGIPPSSGFVSKLSLLQAALDTDHGLIAAVSLIVSLLTLMSMIRLWQKGFESSNRRPIYPTSPLSHPQGRLLTLSPIAVLVALSLSIGLLAGPAFHWSQVAALQVLDREGYIAAVDPTDEIPDLSAAYGHGEEGE